MAIVGMMVKVKMARMALEQNENRLGWSCWDRFPFLRHFPWDCRRSFPCAQFSMIYENVYIHDRLVNAH